MTRAGGGLALLAIMLSVVFLTGCPVQPKPPEQPTSPDALFTGNPRWGHPPLRVQFNDLSKANTSPIRSWVWDFGDGAVSTDRNPVHTYYTSGSYTVSLTVTSAIGSNTLKMTNYITVAEAASVAEIGPEGGTVESPGLRLTVPAGALTRPVIFGITPSTGTVPVSPAQGEVCVSDTYAISANVSPLFVDVRKPLTLEFEFNAAMVPGDDQNAAELHVLSYEQDMYGVPIVGEVDGQTLRVDVSGLPAMAYYGVVYRPQASLAQFNAAVPAKTPTSYLWPTNSWRMSYSARTLQELTALRIGSLLSTRSYDRRTWIAPQLDETLADLRAGVSQIHMQAQDAGFISPALVRSANQEYTVIFYPITEEPSYEYESIDELKYTTSVFGQIVVDPAQLIAICKNNAGLGFDQAQEMEFNNAFAEEFSRTIFRGYDYPLYTALAPMDLNMLGQATQVPFYRGVEQGFATYYGQLAGGVFMARSLGPNETALVSEPVFAPFSSVEPLYSYATQDFFFYVMRRFNLDDFEDQAHNPLLYIGESYDGFLEVMRTRSRMPLVDSFEDAMAALRTSANISLEYSFGHGLDEVYWEYARGRAYENTTVSEIRPTDQSRQAFTLNEDRFSDNAIEKATFTQLNTPMTLSASNSAALNDIPPLSTRAVVLNSGQVSGALEININAYDWDPDMYANTMRVKVYAGAEGVELSPTDSQLAWPHFGENGTGGFKKAVIIISNVSVDRTYDATITARVKSTGTAIKLLGALGGTVVADAPIAGVTVEAQTEGFSASTTTNAAGEFGFEGVPAGDVTLVFTKPGYASRTVTQAVLPNEVSTLQVELAAAE